MKGIVVSFAAWLGILQIPMAVPSPLSVAGTVQLLGAAGAFASLTVMVYRLGVWRQEMYNTKHDVGAEVARYREESLKSFERLERRFTAFDQFVAHAIEQRVTSERWQTRVESRLERLEGEGA